MRFLLLIPLGAIIGAVIARSFFLNFIEEAAFRAAWTAKDYVHFGFDDLRMALKTDTGQKIFAGAIVGASMGWLTGYVMGMGRRRTSRG